MGTAVTVLLWVVAAAVGLPVLVFLAILALSAYVAMRD